MLAIGLCLICFKTENMCVNRGYAEKEGDARQFHPSLRPPVNPEELEIDDRTGMKACMIFLAPIYL